MDLLQGVGIAKTSYRMRDYTGLNLLKFFVSVDSFGRSAWCLTVQALAHLFGAVNLPGFSLSSERCSLLRWVFFCPDSAEEALPHAV
jgi:hypothetical protein